VARSGTEDFAARAESILRVEPVVWLSTVSPDGRPHLVPIWFWWDGTALLIASKPNARKIANLRVNPSCMLAVGDAAADFDVALIEARAEMTSIPTRALLDAGLLRKYRDKMLAIGLERDDFEATYCQVIRITPNRWLPWHGRTANRAPAGLAVSSDALVAVPA
jgi:PPOX class probable F420-dependent enzyme